MQETQLYYCMVSTFSEMYYCLLQIVLESTFALVQCGQEESTFFIIIMKYSVTLLSTVDSTCILN